jgi:hypothetical protein
MCVVYETTRRPGESSDDHLVDKVLPPTQVDTPMCLSTPVGGHDLSLNLDVRRGEKMPFSVLSVWVVPLSFSRCVV